MTTIYAVLNDQVLTASVLPKIACNNINTVRLHVDFDTAWDAYAARSAVFYTDKDPTRYEVIFSGEGNCLVPPEVLTEKGKLYISVKGVSGGAVKASTELEYKILAGTPSMVISDPTGSVYGQLLEALAVERARINNLAALKEGSTTGDAELADIRVGADGETYETAGDAVREQVGQLQDGVDELKLCLINNNKTETLRILENLFRVGVGYSNKDGTLTESVQEARASTPVFVLKNELVVTPIISGAMVAYWEVGEDNSIIIDSGWSVSGHTIPSNTKVAIVVGYNDNRPLAGDDFIANYEFVSTYDTIATEDLTQELGQSAEKVISQNAITNELCKIYPRLISELVKSFMVLSKQWGASVGSVTAKNSAIAARGCCDFFIKLPVPIEIESTDTIYNFALVYVDDEGVVTSDIGWKTSYTVPANQRFVFSVWHTGGVELTEETIMTLVTVNPVITDDDDISKSVCVEYGRYDGATYTFVRIPKTSNNGAVIKPVIALTSLDASLDGTKCSTLTYSKRNNLQFALNGGLFNVSTMQPVGQTIIDGVSITNTPMKDDNGTAISDTECYPLCIDENGDLSTPYDRSVDTATMIEDGIKYAITGWGKLVDNFEIAQSDIDAEIVHTGKNYSRQCIGQFENGDYCVLTAWGGGYNTNYQNEAGLTYEECAQILVDHGVKFAYSLDGGGSAETVIKRRQISPIYEGISGRSVPTVIYFTTNE